MMMIYFITIYYRTNDIHVIRKIQERLGFPRCMNINYEWPVILFDKDLPLFRELVNQKLIAVRHNKEITKMEATDLFIERIDAFLKREAKADVEFAKKMEMQPGKTAKAACNFILSEVSRSKRNGWADEEIYGMAKHFIDEVDLLDPGSNANDVSRIVVDTHVDLSEEEKQEALGIAKREFRQKLEDDYNRKMAKRSGRRQKSRDKAVTVTMGDLFGGQY